jgi:hypothetical protein
MPKNRFHQVLSFVVMGSLLLLTLGLGCGNAADVDPKACCKKNSSCHRGHDGPMDPKKCCQEKEQTKPTPNAQSTADLTKKSLQWVSLEVTSIESWTGGNPLTFDPIPTLTLFNFPRQQIYKLTSSFLI